MSAFRTRPYFKAPYEDGHQKQSISENLGINFDPTRPSKNSIHWPFASAIRELISNAIDACLESMKELNQIPMIEVIPSNIIPYSGVISINKCLAITFKVCIDVVESNDKHLYKTKDTGKYPVKFIESKTIFDIKNSKNNKKTNKKEDFDEDVYSDDDIEINKSDMDNKKSKKNESKKNETSNQNNFYHNLSTTTNSNGTYRVSLFIRNIGAALPVEAWISSCSSKGHETNPILHECIIGGFGYGLKDSVLSLFRHDFMEFHMYGYDPNENNNVNFYRGR